MNVKKIAALAALSALTGCAWDRRPDADAAPAERTAAKGEQAVALAGNEFAFDLYARLRADESGNLFFSPYSISTALAMVHAGAAGKTQAEMAKTLHFPGRQAQLSPVHRSLRARLESNADGGETRLRIANRLWGQDGYPFRPEFLAVTRDDYGAEMAVVDFSQTEAARRTINAWIGEQTEQKIPELLSSDALDDRSRLVLTNAVYFHGLWSSPFREHATVDAPFHASATESIKTSTMRLETELNYGKAEGVEILELPYGPSKRLSMLVLLPDRGNGLTDLEKRLTNKNLQAWTKELRPTSVDVSLPKFKLTSEFRLDKALASLGMSRVFSHDADLSRMATQEDLFLSAVYHKAFVDVNEAGTEATAATGASILVTSAPPLPKLAIPFRADHPFVFLIRDGQTQSILFLGRLTNPKD